MNQFFYNMVSTYWALKHVLFVINYKVLTMHGEGKKKGCFAPSNPTRIASFGFHDRQTGFELID